MDEQELRPAAVEAVEEDAGAALGRHDPDGSPALRAGRRRSGDRSARQALPRAKAPASVSRVPLRGSSRPDGERDQQLGPQLRGVDPRALALAALTDRA